MKAELLPGTTNVVRFPVEDRARPTLDLMRDLAPDVRAVEMVAETYDLPLPTFGFRHRVDAEAAEHILNDVTDVPGAARDDALRALLNPVAAAAVAAARVWRKAARDVEVMEIRVAQAGRQGVAVLEHQYGEMQRKAAELLLEAYLLSEEAEGVAPAVHLARSGQVWVPYDLHAEAEALFGMSFQRQA